MRTSRHQEMKGGIPVYRIGHRRRQGISRRPLFIPDNGNRYFCVNVLDAI